MIKVGITGGIGSGKTTVCKIFEQMDIPVYYADTQAKELMYKDPQLKSAIKDLLGSHAYYKNGRLNRAYVAKMIFSNKETLSKINNLVHPVVGKHAAEWFSRQSSKYAIQEAALLVENASYKKLDKLIVVTAPSELRIKRVIARDKSSLEKVKERIKNQLPEEEKIKVADFVIDNSGETSLIHQIWSVHRNILASIDK